MPIKIVVTGPESTGKTTLCTQLSERYKGTMIPEFSRVYLNKSNRQYQLRDIEHMGLVQTEMNNNASAKDRIVFCDTDALTYYIWAFEKYKTESTVLKDAFLKNPPDLYLLCFPDLKWEYDLLREHPDNLHGLFDIYLEQIVKSKAKYAIIYGVGRIRKNRAIYFINSHLQDLISFAS
jgi:nicotinamide riboside kinase